MPITNFSIPTKLDQRIKQVILKKGLSGKAEFFRFAAVYFMDVIDKPYFSEDERFAYLVSTIKKRASKAYGGKKIATVREQLADL